MATTERTFCSVVPRRCKAYIVGPSQGTFEWTAVRRETKLSAPWLPVPVCKAPAMCVCVAWRESYQLARLHLASPGVWTPTAVLLVLFSFPLKGGRRSNDWHLLKWQRLLFHLSTWKPVSSLTSLWCATYCATRPHRMSSFHFLTQHVVSWGSEFLFGIKYCKNIEHANRMSSFCSLNSEDEVDAVFF